MSKCGAEMAPACVERGFAFGTLGSREQVRLLAAFAKDFGDGARVVISLQVGFVQPVVDCLAWWFASCLER